MNLVREDLVMDARYTISELTYFLGCTSRALRFYESKGLLNPVRSGPVRLYDEADRQRATLIVLMRKAGAGLSEIAAMIDAPTTQEQTRLVREEFEKLRADMKRQEAALTQAERVLTQGQNLAMRPSFRAPRHVAHESE